MRGSRGGSKSSLRPNGALVNSRGRQPLARMGLANPGGFRPRLLTSAPLGRRNVTPLSRVAAFVSLLALLLLAGATSAQKKKKAPDGPLFVARTINGKEVKGELAEI